MKGHNSPTCAFPGHALYSQSVREAPRADNARHFLTDILVIAILAVMCGLDDYPGIVEYGRDELDWLKTFLGLPHGIPSASTFRRLFAALKPAVLLNVMRRWSGELSGIPASCASIDGRSQMILPCLLDQGNCLGIKAFFLHW